MSDINKGNTRLASSFTMRTRDALNLCVVTLNTLLPLLRELYGCNEHTKSTDVK